MPRTGVIKKDDLESVLTSSEYISDVEWVYSQIKDFSRKIKFCVMGATYNIEWWSNISYLLLPNDMVIPFSSVKVSGTWPNEYKNNLQFYHNGEICAILPIEHYGKGK